MENKFITPPELYLKGQKGAKTKHLSMYGLACGYIQKREMSNGNYKELYFEHGHFKVRWGKKGGIPIGLEVFNGRQLSLARDTWSKIKLTLI